MGWPTLCKDSWNIPFRRVHTAHSAHPPTPQALWDPNGQAQDLSAYYLLPGKVFFLVSYYYCRTRTLQDNGFSFPNPLFSQLYPNLVVFPQLRVSMYPLGLYCMYISSTLLAPHVFSSAAVFTRNVSSPGHLNLLFPSLGARPNPSPL